MFSRIFYLNSNDGTGLVGFGEGVVYRHQSENIKDLQKFIDAHQGKYIFTAFSYDLKNAFYDLRSDNFDGIAFPDAILYVPDNVVRIDQENWKIVQGLGLDKSELNNLRDYLISQGPMNPISLRPRTNKSSYLSNVKSLLGELQYGNIYEVNYCQEYYAENINLEDPIALYNQINEGTKTPFSTFFRLDEFTLMSASPERYLMKKGSKIISQPIKGTIKRGANHSEDEELKAQLLNDPKERSENVMIVDLVRNDLSKFAKKNSVNVDELFGIYSFETVHQMISTVSCECDPNISISEILMATFPMGSMTGAPKHSAMQLIEKHEEFKRGLYSGSVGYIEPNGNFDLNVIIRSVLHNALNGYLSCAVGGAITIESNPEKEYQECETKINKILSILREQN